VAPEGPDVLASGMDVGQLVDLLCVRSAAADRFTGHSPADRERSVYGGQFLGQALMAAAGTVDHDRLPHSLHAYFVRGGAPASPITYDVERVRDGRTFSHRSVTAVQDGREVFRQLQSFHRPSEGPLHRAPVELDPDRDPATFPDYRAWVADLSDNTDHPWFHEAVPVELRIQDPPDPRPRRPMAGTLRIWMRLAEPAPTEDPLIHAALLAWMSDKTISDVTLYPHGRSWTDAGANVLSLDHAMWFYEPVRADQWLLLTHDVPATGGGRGFVRGDLVTGTGRRVGAVCQEALLSVP
jgi:acyl-CoA thioesterase II